MNITPIFKHQDPLLIKQGIFNIIYIIPKSISGKIMSFSLICSIIIFLYAFYKNEYLSQKAKSFFYAISIIFPICFALTLAFIDSKLNVPYDSLFLETKTKTIGQPDQLDTYQTQNNLDKEINNVYGLSVLKHDELYVDNSLYISENILVSKNNKLAQECNVETISSSKQNIKAILICNGSEPSKVK